MIKKHEFNYLGMSKDSSRDLQSDKYFDAENIRVTAEDDKSKMAITNEKGNKIIFSIPSPVINFADTSITYTLGVQAKSLVYKATEASHPRCEIESQFMLDSSTAKISGNQVIIGIKELRDSAIIITTDDAGFDCIWELTGLNNDNYDLELLYMADLDMSKNNLCQIIYNYENAIIQKIYFADGVHQVRYLNIRQSIENGDTRNLVDVSPSLLDIVSTYTLDQPQISSVVGGGSHTAGKIQYSYSLYILNGAQTVPSPLSGLVPIDKGQNNGGGDLNQPLGRAVNIKVEGIDPKFTHIKIYSIKYTSYNQTPEVSVVAEREIDNFDVFNFVDTGASDESISLEQFLFLGSSPMIPQHIATKDNRMFPVNIKEQSFDVDIDTRAFSFSTVDVGAVAFYNILFPMTGSVSGSGNFVFYLNDVEYSMPVTNGQTLMQMATNLYNFCDSQSDLASFAPVELGTGRIQVPVRHVNIGEVTEPYIAPNQFGLTIEPDFFQGALNRSVSRVLNNAYLGDDQTVQGESTLIISDNIDLPDNHDAINKDYNTYKYKSDGVTLGATGKYLDIDVIQTSYNLGFPEAQKLTLLKDREIYRIGVKFYNRRGQSSSPKWIMDLQAPEGNLNGLFSSLKLTMNSDFYVWLNDSSNFEGEDDKPIGYKLLRADRGLNDQTIFAQGIINPMVANKATSDLHYTFEQRKNTCVSPSSTKIPSQIRKFKNETPILGCQNYHLLNWGFQSADVGANANQTTYNHETNEWETNSVFFGPRYWTTRGSRKLKETWKTGIGGHMIAENMQFNHLMQFFSPDVLFKDGIAIDSSYELRVLGLIKETGKYNWSSETPPTAERLDHSAQYVGGLVGGYGAGTTNIIGNHNFLNDFSFFGPTNDSDNISTQQTFRQFNGNLYPATTNEEDNTYKVYGNPEVTDEGANFKNYNNDPRLRYSNNLKTMIQDNFDGDDANDGAHVQLLGVNSNGSKCITFALGSPSKDYPTEDRPAIEDLYEAASIDPAANGDGVLLTEFSKPEYIKYLGEIYGGMSYEDKRNSEYIEIGSYTAINDIILVTSPGDTYVNTFTFTKIAKDDFLETQQTYNRMTEIVEFRVETTIDLKNRNDLSNISWNDRQEPKHSEYTNYNEVYSQQPILTKTSDLGFKFKRVQEFDTRIISTKVKVPGEFIDSWTDILENETLDLDGQYGPINAVMTLKDEIFCLQDTAVAHLAVNPRVQVAAGDGVGLELGTGGILHDYRYLTTTIGCLNKFGAISTENTFYFVDIINKGIMAYDGQTVSRFSDLKGFHHTLVNDLSYDNLVIDNAVLGNGISLGYNPTSADVYFTFKQNTISAAKTSFSNFTLTFNEKIGEFTSYYSYTPAWYLNKGNTLISSGKSNSSVWEHGTGVPNNFYGTSHPSTLTLHVAPPGNEIIINSAEYKMETTDSYGKDLPTTGLTHVQTSNDYQDSGKVALRLRKNMFKKFRHWKITLPRERNKRERLRSAWGFVKFTFDNPDGNNMVLHNISIFYTQH